MLYVLCGGDAAGKATQAKILAARLGCEVLAFPDYESPTGRAIKAYLQGAWEIRGTEPNSRTREGLGDLVLQCLMTVNRLEHYDRLARSAGHPTDHLVLDRYWASALAYGSVEGLDPAWLELVHRGLPRADRWVLIDLDPRVGFERRPERRDRNERDLEKLQKVRGAYLGVFADRRAQRAGSCMAGESCPCRAGKPTWSVVDGLGTVDEVAARVAEAVGL